MHGMARFKVPNGKLLVVRIDFSDKMDSVQITGDFFMHPEEGITDIENALAGRGLNDTKESIASVVAKVVLAKKIEMIGVTPEAIGEAVVIALKSTS